MPPIDPDRPALPNSKQSRDEQVQGQNAGHEIGSLPFLQEWSDARADQVSYEHGHEEDLPGKPVKRAAFARRNRGNTGHEPDSPTADVRIEQGVCRQPDPEWCVRADFKFCGMGGPGTEECQCQNACQNRNGVSGHGIDLYRKSILSINGKSAIANPSVGICHFLRHREHILEHFRRQAAGVRVVPAAMIG